MGLPLIKDMYKAMLNKGGKGVVFLISRRTPY
jgi:hypothetical protein